MDVYWTLDGQGFVWDSEKAAANASRHGVRFEQAREVFLDQLARYETRVPKTRHGRSALDSQRSTGFCMSSMWFEKVMCSASSPHVLRSRRKGDAMRMTDRIERNMQPDKPMTMISIRLPDHVIDDLKEVAPTLGFGGYQALIRAYISNGLRKHLAEREAQRAKESTVEEFSQRLLAHGVPEQAIQEAVAEMRAAR